MELKERIEEIIAGAITESLTIEEASERILLLLNVSGRSEQLTAFAAWFEDNYSFKISDMILEEYKRYGG